MTSTDLFVASWPVDDQDLTLKDVIAEAEVDLPDLLYDACAEIVGKKRWAIARALGALAHEEQALLVLTAPAAPWADTVRPPRGRPRG